MRNNKILKLGTDRKGYRYINVSIHGCVKPYRVHRLVAMAFIENTLNEIEVNHIDGNKNNNRVDNLEWCSHKQNMRHAFENGLISKQTIKENVKNMNNATKKRVYQYKNGKLIKIYDSVSSAFRETKISHISCVANGKRKFAGGYTWKYE